MDKVLIDREEQLRLTPVKGSNQVHVRSFNERLILHLIRQYGELTKAEATRATGLSPNAISTIFRSLEEERLLLRQAPIRGRIGQPSTPLRLNPAARHYLGIKIGRRSLDLVLIDFVGTILARRVIPHDFPIPRELINTVRAELEPLLLSAQKRPDDIDALGVAMPSELWNWTQEFGAPRSEMEAWRDFDVASALQQIIPVPVTIENDATAACRAELVLRPHRPEQDIIYFFIGTFIGGGIILNGSVYTGRRGNAGGFGPLRVPDEPGGQRLVDHASLVVLEKMIASRGQDPFLLQNVAEDWSEIGPDLSQWIARAARSLAHAIVSTLAVIDFEAVIIDGAFPDACRTRLVQAVGDELSKLDLQGVVRPDLSCGHLGTTARALGGAVKHISANYMINQSSPPLNA
jgi:predicted NBD/HSP70 family sugar kinase